MQFSSRSNRGGQSIDRRGDWGLPRITKALCRSPNCRKRIAGCQGHSVTFISAGDQIAKVFKQFAVGTSFHLGSLISRRSSSSVSSPGNRHAVPFGESAESSVSCVNSANLLFGSGQKYPHHGTHGGFRRITRHSLMHQKNPESRITAFS